MKKVLFTALMGMGLAILPCYGAICSQTDWLDEPVLAADYEMERITVVPEPITGTEPEPAEVMTHTRRAILSPTGGSLIT